MSLKKENTVLIYSPTKSNRLEYACSIFFKQLLSLEYIFTTNKDIYQTSSLPSINYSYHSLKATEFFIPAHGLLFEKTIEIQKIQIYHQAGLAYFFYKDKPKTDLPFDILAMTFYLVSRYEEYLNFEADKHGRFTATQSLAYKHHFLAIPLLHLWATKVSHLLQKKISTLFIKLPSYQYVPSYDVDMAWAYCHKGWYRSIGASFRDLYMRQFTTFLKRMRVQVGLEDDPFFKFGYLQNLHQKYNKSAIFFFLLGNYSRFDKNIKHNNQYLQQLIQHLQQYFEVGIHPSYASNTSIQLVQQEIKRLQDITNQAITKSRQHFLKLHLPITYRHLLQVGIKSDYSMGYAEQIGFRASIAIPFYWYDLEKDKRTELLVHPFQIMDVTLKYYMQLSPEKAVSTASTLIDTSKKVGGTITTLWHNSSFSAVDDWEEWQAVYEAIFAKAMEK